MLSGKNWPKHAGSDDCSAISSYQRLGTQGIHRLRTGDTRHIFHAERGELAILSQRHIGRPLRVGKERDCGRARRQWRQAGRIEGLHAQHDIRLVEGMLGDQGASRLVRRIGQQGGGAGTGLHGHLVTRRTKPAHQLRNHCNTRLAGSLFPGHRDAHVTNLMHPFKSCSRIAL